jgi:hypothetical protein
MKKSATNNTIAHTWDTLIVIGKGKAVPVLKYHATKTYWGSRGIAPCILNLAIRWRCVVSFTSPDTLPPEKEPPVLF